MNIISISGNVTKDMELRYLPDGSAVGSFGIADNMVGRDKGAIFWQCSFFGKRAESVAQYVTKGSPVTVNGTVSERKYTNKDGVEVRSMDVRVNDIALQGGKREQSDSGYQATRAAPASRQAPAPAAGFNDMDDDLPF